MPQSVDLVGIVKGKEVTRFGTSRNGRVVVAVVGKMEVRGWDAHTSKELWTTTLEEPIDALAISPTGSLVALGTSSGISIYTALTGTATAIVAPLAGTPSGKNRLRIQHLAFLQTSQKVSLLASSRFGQFFKWDVGVDGSAPDIVVREDDGVEEGRPDDHVSARFCVSWDGGVGVWWREGVAGKMIVNAYRLEMKEGGGVKQDVEKKLTKPGLSVSTQPLVSRSNLILVDLWKRTDVVACGSYPFVPSPDNTRLIVRTKTGVSSTSLQTGVAQWSTDVSSFGVSDELVNVMCLGRLVMGVTKGGWVVVSDVETGSALFRGRVGIKEEEEVTASALVEPDASVRSYGHIVVSTSLGRLTSVRLPCAWVIQCVSGSAGVVPQGFQWLGSKPVETLAWARDKTGLMVADGISQCKTRRIGLALGGTVPALVTSKGGDAEDGHAVLVAEVQIQSGVATLRVSSSGKIVLTPRDPAAATSPIEALTSNPAIIHPHGASIISATIDEGKKIIILDASGSITLYALPTTLTPDPAQPEANILTSSWTLRSHVDSLLV
ncbi:hypothetical protein BC829DRAFT_43498 [Chytridium lagenaria]|nr:hypothetical protein BC829DRAFT_43498 [Chytridium lagenaria]